MTLPDMILLASFILGTLFILAAAVNALYFHFHYQKELDQQVMKAEYYESGLLMGVNRLMLYGHYCLFPERAQRDNVREVFANLERAKRRHLIFHWMAVIAAGLFYFGGYGLFELAEFLG